MCEHADTSRRRARRRAQFGILTLFGFVTAVALGFHWYVQHRKVDDARAAYDETAELFDVNSVSATEVCHASVKLCKAERDLPFGNATEAQAKHLARVQRIELLMWLFLNDRPWEDSILNELEAIRAIRVDAEQALRALDPHYPYSME